MLEAMSSRIGVIIPCYNVKNHILSVIAGIGSETEKIFVVDDACPQQTGAYVREHCKDPRVEVLSLPENHGVGGATLYGFLEALNADLDIIVKLDGDGQMNPALIPDLVRPIEEQRADYCKGNRFYTMESLAGMPLLRLLGNSVLSFVNKAVSGYWNLMDPNNGFVAIHSSVLHLLPLNKLDERYFFESDMLFRLNTIRAVVCELPIDSRYEEEESNLRVEKIALEFPFKYLTRLSKRIIYNYFIRDFNVCSIELIFGLAFCLWGFGFGLFSWYEGSIEGTFASGGTVMLAALPIILGFQLLLAAVSYDVNNIPKEPLQNCLPKKKHPEKESSNSPRVANF